MLRHGCENEVLPEYLAHPCATAGRLEDALDGLVDDELLDGACTIVRALVNGGPAEDIDDYEPGPRVAAAVVELVAERPPSVVPPGRGGRHPRWAEDFEEHVAIAERCGRAARPPPGAPFVAEPPRAVRQAAPRLANRRGDGARPMGGRLAPPAGRAGGRRAVLPARADAERGALGAPRRRSPSASCRWRGWPAVPRTGCSPPSAARPRTLSAALVLEMRPGRWSAPLVAAALLSPVIFTRNAALHALEHTETSEWGAPVHTALRRLAEVEPTDDVRARAREQLSRLDG